MAAQDKITSNDIFSAQLQKILDLKGFSQSELALKSGISQGVISNYVTGRRAPTAAQVLKISLVLNVSMEDLLLGDSEVSEEVGNCGHVSTIQKGTVSPLLEEPGIPHQKVHSARREFRSVELRAREDMSKAIELRRRAKGIRARAVEMTNTADAMAVDLEKVAQRLEEDANIVLSELDGDQEMASNEVVPITTLPFLGEVAAGAPVLSEINEEIEVGGEWPEEHFVVRINGESGGSKYPDGSLWIIDARNAFTPRSGRPAVICDEAGNYLKKWNNRKKVFESIDPAFDDVIPGSEAKLRGYPVQRVD